MTPGGDRPPVGVEHEAPPTGEPKGELATAICVLAFLMAAGWFLLAVLS